jgi:NADH:ubiquinone oxidoreductase subunit 6 (subunit J)
MGFWEPLIFWIFALGALASSLAVVLFRNPLYSALVLIADFFCFAGLYVLLSAHFMAVIQVLVYGGAIMVLFLFIIMLLNLSDEDLGPRRFSLHQILAVFAAAGVFVFAVSSVLAVVDLGEVDEAISAAEAQIEEREAAEAEALAANPDAEPLAQPTIVEVPTAVPGLYAFSTEDAVQARFTATIESWEDGESTYATDKYPRFDETQPFVVPPGLRASLPSGETPGKVMGPDGRPIDLRSSGDDERGDVFGTVEPVSLLLVNRFVVPFELTAVLLLAAIIGAVILAKKRL